QRRRLCRQVGAAARRIGANVIDSQRRTLFWVLLAAVGVFALWRLSDILLPFVMGMAIAYFLDPLVDWLERRRCPRTWGTVIVIAVFTALLVALLLVMVPLCREESRPL